MVSGSREVSTRFDQQVGVDGQDVVQVGQSACQVDPPDLREARVPPVQAGEGPLELSDHLIQEEESVVEVDLGILASLVQEKEADLDSVPLSGSREAALMISCLLVITAASRLTEDLSPGVHVKVIYDPGTRAGVREVVLERQIREARDHEDQVDNIADGNRQSLLRDASGCCGGGGRGLAAGSSGRGARGAEQLGPG